MKAFTYQSLPMRVIFGEGALAGVAGEVERLGARSALVLCTEAQRASAENVARLLGQRAAGVYDKAQMHVPIETAEEARHVAADLGADCCVAIGGGSTIGLGKAIAMTSELPIVAIPTTFAGSEMTPIYGITEGGLKRTGRDARVLPASVIYDPALTATLPPRIAATSGINAIAHSVEALYAQDANPIISLMAEESIRALAASLPRVVANPGDAGAASDALYGAWLAGACLGAVGMAIHHKLCHTLGGTFNLPHAEMHTIVLPHSIAYNRHAAPEAMARVSAALGGAEAASGIYDLAERLGAPMALADIGMPADGLARAAELATQNPYYNPRPIEQAAILELLRDAYAGRRPPPA
ncbi:maleylacetate reductase [Thauera sinica]|uniref:Maleylacetate reductase n=1 Tax=Thauera sinica TaxID=2665146 RepID=A0ABW1AN23_9RHOO|nr:maleylacetate reductase [Thauera sp. K11]ATE61656.1 maleylacetate reductase [Thauera sp. K11]